MLPIFLKSTTWNLAQFDNTIVTIEMSCQGNYVVMCVAKCVCGGTECEDSTGSKVFLIPCRKMVYTKNTIKIPHFLD